MQRRVVFPFGHAFTKTRQNTVRVLILRDAAYSYHPQTYGRPVLPSSTQFLHKSPDSLTW